MAFVAEKRLNTESMPSGFVPGPPSSPIAASEPDVTTARDLEHRAEIPSTRDIVANHGLHVLQEIPPPDCRCLRHISPFPA